MSKIIGIIDDRYELLELLGQGGVSRVYRATDRADNSTVALKLLHAKYLGEGRVRRRFMREARAFERLKHPNIVRMIDYGEGSEGPYIALEYLEGDTLSAWRDKVSFEQLISLVVDILGGLSAAHASVYHRDIKPENVIVQESEAGLTAVVLDFGFARLDDEDGETKQDAFGTPRYMAPEQISHNAHRSCDRHLFTCSHSVRVSYGGAAF